jgi:diaminopimelate decarboxylase
MNIHNKLENSLNKINTPCIIYFEDIIKNSILIFNDMFEILDPILLYSVKCMPNLYIINCLKRLGIHGFDISNIGELSLITKLLNSDKIVIHATSPGLMENEFIQISKGSNIINCDSITQLMYAVNSKIANYGLRLNHSNISIFPDKSTRFGFHYSELPFINEICKSFNSKPKSLHFHFDGGIKTLYFHTEYLKFLVENFRLFNLDDLFSEIKYINLGGGVRPVYFDKYLNYENNDFETKSILLFLEALNIFKARFNLNNTKVIFELGEFLLDTSGFFVCEIIDRKIRKNGNSVWILNTNMNHLSGFSNFNISGDVIFPIQSSTGFFVELGGNTCFRNDLLGLIQVKEEDFWNCKYILIKERGAYYYARSNCFNGRLRPNIYYVNQSDEIELIKQDSIDTYLNHIV